MSELEHRFDTFSAPTHAYMGVCARGKIDGIEFALVSDTVPNLTALWLRMGMKEIDPKMVYRVAICGQSELTKPRLASVPK